MRSFDQIADWITQHYTVTGMEPHLLSVELSLEHGNRHQSVFLSELIDDDGGLVLRVSTIVGEVTAHEASLTKALAFNWQSRTGFLALAEIGGKQLLKLCENLPYDSLSIGTLERALLRVGGMGDSIERQLQDADAY
jgi:hypothetical protein